ncbi:MAG: DUF2059 domain-containing protein [Candidatus Acidiferrales bacterium]|jgi:hypothetical protein
MRFLKGILAAAVCLAGPALAETPAAGTPQAAPQHQPGTLPASRLTSPAGTSPDQPPTLEKPDPAKEAAIRHLMDITQTSKLGDSITSAITAQVRQVMGRSIQNPQELQKFMDSFTQKFNAEAPSSAVTDAEIPVYSHYFSMEDIQALIKFYESPLGQHVVKTLPQVAQQTQQAGVQMDQKAALDVLRSMSTDYPELKQLLPPEPGAPTPGAGPGAGASSAPSPAAPVVPPAPPAPPVK